MESEHTLTESKKRRLEIFLLPVIASLIFIVDQVSKHFVVTGLAVGESWDIAAWTAPVLSITHVTNTGVAFGMFQHLNTVFIVLNLIVMVIIVLYYRQLPAGEWFMRVSLSLAMGGAAGNWIDRLRFGSVTDFIDVNFWPFHNFPIFNVADSCILIGVTLMAGYLWWEERHAQQEIETPVAEAPGSGIRGAEEASLYD